MLTVKLLMLLIQNWNKVFKRRTIAFRVFKTVTENAVGIKYRYNQHLPVNAMHRQKFLYLLDHARMQKCQLSTSIIE